MCLLPSQGQEHHGIMSGLPRGYSSVRSRPWPLQPLHCPGRVQAVTDGRLWRTRAMLYCGGTKRGGWSGSRNLEGFPPPAFTTPSHPSKVHPVTFVCKTFGEERKGLGLMFIDCIRFIKTDMSACGQSLAGVEEKESPISPSNYRRSGSKPRGPLYHVATQPPLVRSQGHCYLIGSGKTGGADCEFKLQYLSREQAKRNIYFLVRSSFTASQALSVI